VTGELDRSGTVLVYTVGYQVIESEDPPGFRRAADRLIEMINSQDQLTRCEGALGSVLLFFILHQFERATERLICSDALRRVGESLVKMLNGNQPDEQFSAAFALVWLGECNSWSPPSEPDLLTRLFTLWRYSENSDVARMANWALITQPLEPREGSSRFAVISPEELEWLSLPKNSPVISDEHVTQTKLIMSWYRGMPWNATEITEKANALLKEANISRNFTNKLNNIILAANH
jgi:hypothetical protein